MSQLNAWATFYTAIGSSAAALTGLMFVVITLIQRNQSRETRRIGIAAYSTPTVMHFSTALLVSAILLAPWKAYAVPAILTGLIGIAGIVYIVRVMQLTRRTDAYEPDIEDLVWYHILPLVAYGIVCAAATALFAFAPKALFFIAGAILLLIFIGIRNAWDVVTFITVELPEERE
jgi:hypothetical protein